MNRVFENHRKSTHAIFGKTRFNLYPEILGFSILATAFPNTKIIVRFHLLIKVVGWELAQARFEVVKVAQMLLSI